MLRNSLRFRITAAFCLLSLIAGATLGAFVFGTQLTSEDAVFNNRVRIEMEAFLSRYEKDQDAPLPNSAYIRAHIGQDTMTALEQDLVRGLGPGIHEDEDLDYHIGVAILPNTRDRLYIIYNVFDLEVHVQQMPGTGTLILLTIALFLGLALAFSFFISNKVIAPVTRLAGIVRAADPENPETGFARGFYNDEVGFLADALEQYLNRIRRYIETEKSFSMGASHELRTPVTAIKGAVDVIQRTPEFSSPGISRPAARIQRAVRDMENIIETFLALSRLQNCLPEPESFAAEPVVRDLAAQNRYLLLNREVAVEIDGGEPGEVTAPAWVFRIVAANLIRNAFQYTRKGKICIRIQGRKLSVSDTGSGIPGQEIPKMILPFNKSPRSKGFGIGLSIVRQLCNRAGWTLEIRSPAGQGTRVTLSF